MELAALVGLALMDSLSLGTLVIPLVLVVTRRRVDVSPLMIYFATVVLVYFGIGVALLAGFDLLTGPLTRVLSSEPAQWIKLVAGAALLAYGVLAPTPEVCDEAQLKVRSLAPAAMVALGLGAVLTEVATMVPYLAANGIISGMDAGWPLRLIVLAGYCLVMILPAGVLIGVAAIWGDRVWPKLEKLVLRLEREAKVTLLWIAAIVGLWMVGSSWGVLRG